MQLNNSNLDSSLWSSLRARRHPRPGILAENGILEWLNLPAAIQSGGIVHYAYQARGRTYDEVWVNSLDPMTGRIGRPFRLRRYDESDMMRRPYDDHGSPAIAVSSEGRLVAAYAKHGSPLRIRVSVHPHNHRRWEPEQVIEDGYSVSYPQLWSLPDRSLILLYRYRHEQHTSSGAIRRSLDGGRTWSERIEVFRQDGTACYWQTYVAGHEVHAAITPFDYGENRYRDVFHMWSPDGGATWNDSSGNVLHLPATRSTATAVVLDDTKQWTWVFELKASPGDPRIIFYDNLGGYGDSARIPNVWHARLVDGDWVKSRVADGASFWSGRGTYPCGAVLDPTDLSRILLAEGSNGTSPDGTLDNPSNNADCTAALTEYTSPDGGLTWERATTIRGEGFAVRPQFVHGATTGIRLIWVDVASYRRFEDWKSCLRGATVPLIARGTL